MNGFGMMHAQHGSHGFCHSCCHPVSQCCCGHRQCRKEAKELLVTPQVKQDDATFVPLDPVDPNVNVTPTNANDDRTTHRVFTVDNADTAGASTYTTAARAATSADVFSPASSELLKLMKGAKGAAAGAGVAFIGGGCCVHLSIEYMSTNANSSVLVLVLDSENTILGWMKYAVQPGYYIKEGIISTKPGAILGVSVSNIVARVRWCEVFSC